MKITKDHLPHDIWEGSLVISRSIPIEIKPSGPQKLIFSGGKFIDKELPAS